jgi:hypothetical protein
MTTGNFVFICKTDESKPVKQEVNSTVILHPLIFPGQGHVGENDLNLLLTEDASPSDNDSASFAIDISSASLAWEASTDAATEAAKQKAKGIFYKLRLKNLNF